MAKSHVRILLVDDFHPFRLYVCSMLHKRSNFRVVGEAANGVEAVAHAAQLRPDLVLLDIGLPKLNGIDAARQIRTASPDSKIIFLSLETSVEIIEEALGAGARGYIIKSAAATELTSGLDLVIRGGCFVGGGCTAGRPDKSKPREGRWQRDQVVL